MQEIGIESSLVERIRSGEKTIEGRLGKPDFLKIREGDILRVREDIWHDNAVIGSHEDTLRIKITRVLYFETFREMLEAVNYEEVLPSATSVDDAVATYARYYSPVDENEYGVVALYFAIMQD